MTDAPKRIWEFDRYINGVLMAEGVTVEKQPDIASAMKAAAIIASRGPHGEVPVLIVREGASEHAALIREAEAERDAASAMAATAYGASLNWEEVLNDEALWQAQDDIAKSRVACMTAEAERDRLAAANAVLEAKVARLVEAVKPFDAVGGTLFSKNWNMSDIVFDGGPMRSDCLFFEDFLNLRAALATQEAGK